MRLIHLIVVFLFVPLYLSAQREASYDEKIPGTPVSFRMIAVPAGKIVLGSKAEPDEQPMKEVSLSGFWMEEHEVTFEEWDAYFKDGSLPQSKQIDGVTRATPQYIDLTWGMGREPHHPTNSMSQQAAMMYCRWLYLKTGHFYRLPTEAEWEYACMAGKNTAPIAGDGWHAGNSGGKFHLVKEKKPNAWGFFDMLGNLSEWTIDQYSADYYSTMPSTNPMAPPAGRYPRTVRGGSFQDVPDALRCSNRIPSDAKWNQRDPQIPKSRWWLTDGVFVGFRVVRPFNQPSASEIEAFFAPYFK